MCASCEDLFDTYIPACSAFSELRKVLDAILGYPLLNTIPDRISSYARVMSYHVPKTSDYSYHFVSEDELEYMSLIQYQIQPFFPKFAAAIAEQSPSLREQGRCAMIDLTPQGHHVTPFESSADLDNALTDILPPPYHVSDQLPRRRLFILEDLPCNQILALGSRLRIPPSFFASHWEDPATSTFNHRNPFQRCSLPHFRVRYATSNRVEVDTPSPSTRKNMGLYAFDTNVCRYLHTYSTESLLHDEARSHHIMSFWASTPREDGSWDAVLLVDPPPGKFVRCLSSRTLVPLRWQLKDETSMPKHFLNPDLDTKPELPQDSSTWTATSSTPQYISMYDDILQAYRSDYVDFTNIHDPLSVVEIPRKLVMSTLLAFVRRRYLNIVNVHKGQMGSQSLRHNYLSSFSNSNMTCWSNES
jgi:hypothetical protein